MLSRRRFLQTSAALALAGHVRAQPGPTGDPHPLPAKAVTRGPKHHFFGYYDKCPWDTAGRTLLAHEIDFADRMPKPGELITLGTVTDDQFQAFDETPAWCWQQGAMLQWRPGRAKEIIYNSVRDGRYVGIVRDATTGTTRELAMPVHFVRPDGGEAVTLDYDRLHRLRPGYGYVALPERNAEQAAPTDMGCYVMSLIAGTSKLIVSLKQLSEYQPDERFVGGHHYINHMQYNPGGSRFLFLHRWTIPASGKWWTRLFTCRPDGSDLRLVLDPSMFSHFDWKDDRTLLAWTRHTPHGDRFFTFSDEANAKLTVFDEALLTRDGHCSYSPDRRWILNDTYPDKNREQTLMLVRAADGQRFDIGKFKAPPQFTGPIRCDLHPRWSRDGRRVCFDSTHDGTRQVYVADVSEIVA